MTNRRLTQQEKEYQEERRKIISLCSSEYVADAPFPRVLREKLSDFLPPSPPDCQWQRDAHSNSDNLIKAPWCDASAMK